MRSITELLAGSAFGRKLAIEAEKEELSERRAIDETVRRERKRRRSVERRHNAIIDPLVAQEAEAQRALDAIRAARVAAQLAKRDELFDIDTTIANGETKLRHTADPRIRQAQLAMYERFDGARATMGFSKQVRRDVVGGSVFDHVGNERSRQRLAAAVRDARDAFTRLALQPADDVPAAIGHIMAPVNEAFDALDLLDDAPAA